jgi:hypothetical protein
MQKITVVIFSILIAAFMSPVTHSYAGVPLNNLEGVGGIAYNPIAYTAGQPWESSLSFESGTAENPSPKKDAEKESLFSLKNIFSKPQMGAWYVRLNDWAPHSDIDWGNISVAETFFKRVEVSYGYQFVCIGGGSNVHKNNIGFKGLLLEENFKSLNFIPAVSAGIIWKHSDVHLDPHVHSSGWDFYLVATKMITQLPRPVLLSAGVLSTQGRVTGVLGFDERRKYATAFANIDVIPFNNIVINNTALGSIAVGFEFKEGARFKDWKDKNYWDVHAAWFANKNLSLVVAWTNTGNTQAKYHGGKFGLGDGFVCSVHYAF